MSGFFHGWNMELQEKLEAIAGHYGLNVQVLKLAEECSEYSSAVHKYRVIITCGDERRDNARKYFRKLEKTAAEGCREKLADVLVIARQIEYLMKDDREFNDEMIRLMNVKADEKLKQIEAESK